MRLAVAELAARRILTIPAGLGLMPDQGDGNDISIVIEFKRHKIRANLALSSGGELVVPDWLRLIAPVLAADQGMHEVRIYLSTRPIWFFEGQQDDAIRVAQARSAAEDNQ